MAKKKKQTRNTGRYVLYLVLASILILNVVFWIGSTKYKIVRLRPSTSYQANDNYVLTEINIAQEIQLANGSTWYYKQLGGAYNYFGDIGANEDEQFFQDYFQRLLVDSSVSVIVLEIRMIRKSDSAEVQFYSDPITLFDSTEIVVNSITPATLTTGSVDTTIIPLNHFLEAFLSLV